MTTAGIHTHDEIFSQPEAWAEALNMLRVRAGELASFYHEGRYGQVLFTGCGSTYYLSLAAAGLFQELSGIPGRGLPASEIWLSTNAVPNGGRTLLVAVSRSGETTETILACEKFLGNRMGDLMTLTCVPGSRLSEMGGLNLVFPFAQELSIAQTRAFSTLYLGTAVLAALWSGLPGLLDEMECLPETGRRLLKGCSARAAQLGREAAYDRTYFLGSGPRYGLACELSLKMKEMSLSHSEPFHFLEFRHGPQSMANETTLIVALLSDGSRAQEELVLKEMEKRGAGVFRMAESGVECSFESGAGEVARSVLYLPAGQVLAFERAVSRGLDPDRPHNLDAVVRLASAGDPG